MAFVARLMSRSNVFKGIMMNHISLRASLLMVGMLVTASAQAAVDSYRFAHVTIATPWYIFLFLLMGVFAPFVLMVVIAWRNAARKAEQDTEDNNQEPVK